MIHSPNRLKFTVSIQSPGSPPEVTSNRPPPPPRFARFTRKRTRTLKKMSSKTTATTEAPERRAMTRREYKLARKDMGLTQRQLAATLGLTARTIVARERGDAPLTIEAELAMVTLLGVFRKNDAEQQKNVAGPSSSS
jgi:DNA-binding XRE family transcriptional regulator